MARRFRQIAGAQLDWNCSPLEKRFFTDTVAAL
jgi:hypothetical protein